MIKHRYEVTGVNHKGQEFTGECIAYDITHAIQLFREVGYSVHTVPFMEQVNAFSRIGIEHICRFKEKR